MSCSSHGVNSKCKVDFLISLVVLKVGVLGSTPEDIYLLRQKIENFSWFFLRSQVEAVIGGRCGLRFPSRQQSKRMLLLQKEPKSLQTTLISERSLKLLVSSVSLILNAYAQREELQTWHSYIGTTVTGTFLLWAALHHQHLPVPVAQRRVIHVFS